MSKRQKSTQRPVEYATGPGDLMAFMLIDDSPFYNGEETPWIEPLIVT